MDVVGSLTHRLTLSYGVDPRSSRGGCALDPTPPGGLAGGRSRSPRRGRAREGGAPTALDELRGAALRPRGRGRSP